MSNFENVINTLEELSNQLLAENVAEWPKTENGPYKDSESPLRVLSHLLKVNSYLYKITGEESYKKRARDLLILAKSLTSDFQNLNFRKKEGKDSSNGLIGPAWLLEGLIHAYKTFSVGDYKSAADKVYSQFLFDKKNRVWLFQNKGKYQLDPTFNHQLWFATQALKLGCKNGELFLSHFIPRMKINECTIFHLTPLSTELSFNSLRQYIRYLKYKKVLKNKSIAYNAFNLLALSECYLENSELTIWNSKNFEKLKKIAINSEFLEVLLDSEYGYRYNPQAPAYLLFGSIFNEDVKGTYLREHKIAFSDFITHEVNKSDFLLKVRNYEYITYLENNNV